jgi:nitrogen fixation/metabolism regulation signal transduction histidine kinase
MSLTIPCTVLLYSDILLKECGSSDPHRADREMIVNETKRCKGIVSALLNFAWQHQVLAQPTDLNVLIWDVIEVERKRDIYANINAENLSKMFMPFFTTRPIGKGTGLGLAIIYGIIWNTHGRVSQNPCH